MADELEKNVESITEKEPSDTPKSQLQVNEFSAELFNHTVHFHVLRMEGSVLLSVGLKPSLSNLAVAMCTSYDSVPAASSLLGDNSDLTSSSLAQKLGRHVDGPKNIPATILLPAKRTGKQFFVSCDLPQNPQLLNAMEERLMEEMNLNPDIF